MVDRSKGHMIALPEQRVSHSVREREGIFVESTWMILLVRSIRVDKNRASSEAPVVEENSGCRAGNCANKEGGGSPACNMARG